MEDIVGLKSIASHCLIGNVPPNLRFCTIDKIGKMIYWRCIFSSKASDEEIELLSCTGTEIIANFSVEEITEEFSRDDSVSPSEIQGNLVFMIDEQTNRELFRKDFGEIDHADLEIELPMYYSILDEEAFFSQIDRLSLKKPVGIGTRLQVSFMKTDDLEYIHKLFGFFSRYELDMRQLVSIVNDSNRSIILDRKKYWYRSLTKKSHPFWKRGRLA